MLNRELQKEEKRMKYKKVVYTKISPEKSKYHRHFYDRHVKKAFIKYLAYSGWFDGVLEEQEINEAKKGYLPKDLDVHHIFPLSGSESMDVHSFTNMSVIHKSTHLAINRQIFYPQLKDVSSMQEGETREIIIPIFKPVDAGRIIAIRNRQTGRPWQMLKSISLAGYTR